MGSSFDGCLRGSFYSSFLVLVNYSPPNFSAAATFFFCSIFMTIYDLFYESLLLCFFYFFTFLSSLYPYRTDIYLR